MADPELTKRIHALLERFAAELVAEIESVLIQRINQRLATIARPPKRLPDERHPLSSRHEQWFRSDRAILDALQLHGALALPALVKEAATPMTTLVQRLNRLRHADLVRMDVRGGTAYYLLTSRGRDELAPPAKKNGKRSKPPKSPRRELTRRRAPSPLTVQRSIVRVLEEARQALDAATIAERLHTKMRAVTLPLVRLRQNGVVTMEDRGGTNWYALVSTTKQEQPAPRPELEAQPSAPAEQTPQVIEPTRSEMPNER
jgi:hypothetical protein